MNEIELLEDMWNYNPISNVYRKGDLEEWKNLIKDVLNQPINDNMELEDLKTINVEDFIQKLVNDEKEEEMVNNLLQENEIETIKNQRL